MLSTEKKNAHLELFVPWLQLLLFRRLQWVLFRLHWMPQWRPWLVSQAQWQLVFHYIGASSAKHHPRNFWAPSINLLSDQSPSAPWSAAHLLALSSFRVWHDARHRENRVCHSGEHQSSWGGLFREWFIIVAGHWAGGRRGPFIHLLTTLIRCHRKTLVRCPSNLAKAAV